MKTYEQLTPAQQEKARETALNALLTAVCEGSVRFSDSLNGDDTQDRIDRAFKKADRMQTPWFAHEYVMEDKKVAEFLTGIANAEAEQALYRNVNESVMNEPILA